MLSIEELTKLLSDIESDRIERTTSTSDTDKFSKAICAFANDLPNHRLPGYLLVGVKDNGTLSGLKVSDQLLQNLGDLRSSGNILPIPALTVYKHSFPDGEVAVVEVQPSDLPPVRYKGQVHIRIGPRKAIASEQEEKILSEKRVSYARSFDASPCRDSELKDLALGIFDSYRREAIAPDVIEENHRTILDQLASLRFFDPKLQCPTHAGILLFGKNPRYYLPGSYIQFLKIDGIHLTDPLFDQTEISGDLLGVLRELDTRIKTGITTKLVAITSLKEKTVPDYPEWAIREILMNAVMHRDYQSNTPIRFYWFLDRIEIHSPGGLYGEVTPENYTRQNSYRNPVIAEAMKSLGYVNRFGHGIQRTQKLLADNGNPPAEFYFETGSVLVIIRRRDI
ncbi:MAG: putative DNA binding domain-containing protein [Firmicutes bacterium]|nr:putative DNA binding domain-containing protein [Bacillota bacterium]